MKKSITRFFSLLLIVTLLLSSTALTGCSGKNKKLIQERIMTFQDSCRELDYMTMLNCIEPKYGAPIRLALTVLETPSSEDISKFLNDFLQNVIGLDYDATEFFSNISFTDLKINVKGKKATVKCKLSFVVVGQKISEKAVISLVTDDEDWYIKGIELK